MSKQTSIDKIRAINIPNFFYIERNIIDKLSLLLKNENIAANNILIISGINYTSKIADIIAKSLDLKYIRLSIDSNDINTINKIKEVIINNNIELVVSVGGGKVLDASKYACNILNKPLIVVPTTLSNDSISSPIAVVKLDTIQSVGVNPPKGIFIDLDIISKAPKDTILAGIGDLVSNISAIEDWKLANEYKGVYIDRFAEIISRNAVERFMYYILRNGNDDKFLIYLAEGLIQSGIAMSIAGSSRPASGAEHLISHALDILLENPKPHGIQVGFATLFTQALRGLDINDILQVYKIFGFPTRFDEINISIEDFRKAIELAPYTRKGRFTILDIINKDMINSALKVAYGIDYG